MADVMDAMPPLIGTSLFGQRERVAFCSYSPEPYRDARRKIMRAVAVMAFLGSSPGASELCDIEEDASSQSAAIHRINSRS
jgi:hypothetical protein